MTEAQWIFEYESLIHKEKEEAEVISSILKAANDSLIRLLGLDLLRADENDTSFMPLALLTANRDAMTMIAKKLEESKALSEAMKAAVSDSDFERVSQAVARGDMDPLTQEDLDRVYESQQRARISEMERIGVKVVQSGSNSAPHVNISEQGTTPPAPMRVEFDDDG